MADKDKRRGFFLPKRNLIILIASIFIIELFIMFVVHFGEFLFITEAILDSILLICLSSPLLYLFLYRPLSIMINEANHAREEIRKYSHIVSVAGGHMSFLDRDYIYRAVNDAYLKAHNKRREDIVGYNVTKLLGQDIFEKLVKDKLDKALAGETVHYESWFDLAGTGKRYMEVFYHPYFEDDKTISGVVVDSRDITIRKKVEIELNEANENLHVLATTDGLTGAYNQRYFYERLETELERALRYSHPLPLLIADIDDFKHYNDKHGHLAGDKVLRDVAECFRKGIRNVDIFARYGGEEFAVLMPEADPNEAEIIADRVRGIIESEPFPNMASQPLGKITVSIGIASYSHDSDTPENLVMKADKAMYRAKSLGKNRVEKGD